MLQTDESGPHHRGRPATTTYQQGQSNAAAAEVPTARALLFPATGRRIFDAAVVTCCPWCRRSHLHRGAHLNGAVRESGCQPSREYLLVVTR